MKSILINLLMLSLGFSQGLTFLKSNKANNVLVFNNNQVSQSVGTFLSDFAAGLNYMNMRASLTVSALNFSSDESLSSLNVGMFYKFNDDHNF